MDLNEIRDQIDEVDDKLISLFSSEAQQRSCSLQKKGIPVTI